MRRSSTDAFYKKPFADALGENVGKRVGLTLMLSETRLRPLIYSSQCLHTHSNQPVLLLQNTNSYRTPLARARTLEKRAQKSTLPGGPKSAVTIYDLAAAFAD